MVCGVARASFGVEWCGVGGFEEKRMDTMWVDYKPVEGLGESGGFAVS
jgi:hypothetical protein